jgi:hypothetical protein
MKKFEIKYKIYEISEDGLLKDPKEDYYGRRVIAYDTYDTMDDAIKELEKDDHSFGDYVILPVAQFYFE